MAKDPLDERMQELAWRSKRTAAEEAELRAWLAAHPEERAGWEAETELTEGLRRLANAPVPSNFTARVLQTVACERAALARGRRPGSQLWRWCVRWLPRTAAAVLVAGLGLFTYEAHQRHQLAQVKQSLEAFAQVASMPSPKALEDFDAVLDLDKPPPADEQLLALFQ